MSYFQKFDYVASVLDKYKIDPKTLYSDLGISRQSWSGYKKSNKIPLEQALNIEHWIDNYEVSFQIVDNRQATAVENNIINIKLYDMPVSAGIILPWSELKVFIFK